MDIKQAPWFQRLGKPEQADVEYVVQTLYDWANVKLAKPSKSVEESPYISSMTIERARNYDLRENYFFSLYAIASVITDKLNPTDTDLLLVTNVFPNNGIIQPRFSDLTAKLSETHELDIDLKVGKRYDRESDARLKIDLQREGCKPIDIIYQWDILSPRHWKAHDKFKSEPIFMVGAYNPKGYGSILSRGANDIPLSNLRIHETLGR